jgi:hypothetical protein
MWRRVRYPAAVAETYVTMERRVHNVALVRLDRLKANARSVPDRATLVGAMIG